MDDLFRQIRRGGIIVPIVIFEVMMILIIVVMGLSGAFSLRDSPLMALVVIQVLVLCLFIVIPVLRHVRWGLAMHVTTTFDKDLGTIVIEGHRVSRSGEILQSRLDRVRQYPLPSTWMFSIQPVILGRKRHQTIALYQLRILNSGWQPISIFQSTNVEMVTDLKRLVEGFLQGGDATGIMERGGVESQQPVAEPGTFFRRSEVPGPVPTGRCPHCGSLPGPNDLFCPRCGAKLST